MTATVVPAPVPMPPNCAAPVVARASPVTEASLNDAGGLTPSTPALAASAGRSAGLHEGLDEARCCCLDRPSSQ